MSDVFSRNLPRGTDYAISRTRSTTSQSLRSPNATSSSSSLMRSRGSVEEERRNSDRGAEADERPAHQILYDKVVSLPRRRAQSAHDIRSQSARNRLLSRGMPSTPNAPSVAATATASAATTAPQSGVTTAAHSGTPSGAQTPQKLLEHAEHEDAEEQVRYKQALVRALEKSYLDEVSKIQREIHELSAGQQGVPARPATASGVYPHLSTATIGLARNSGPLASRTGEVELATYGQAQEGEIGQGSLEFVGSRRPSSGHVDGVGAEKGVQSPLPSKAVEARELLREESRRSLVYQRPSTAVSPSAKRQAQTPLRNLHRPSTASSPQARP